MAETHAFQYQKISTPREIRLLELQPGTSTDEARCNIVHASLDALPSYEALSYTWGDASQRTKLLCTPGPGSLSITKNLDVVLHNLRREDSARTLWVDAVCINQDDVAERGQQVGLMREIYSLAEQVIAWVGEELDIDKAVMEMAHAPPAKDPSSDVNPNALFRGIVAVTEFIKRPYFSRVWIIQEVALSSKLVIQCGQRLMPWETFIGAVQILFEMSRQDRKLVKADISLDRIEFLETAKAMAFQNKTELPRSNGTPFSRFGFEEVLDITMSLSQQRGDAQFFVTGARLFQATDPRDHIYGLLGFINESDPSYVPPDYERTFSEIYRDFVRKTIQRSGSLDILGQIDGLVGEASVLPSWVPDWRRMSHVEPLSSRHNKHYKTSGYSKAKLKQSTDSNVLTLSGMLVDEIKELRPGLKPEVDADYAETTQSYISKYIDSALNMAKERYPAGREIINNLRAALRDNHVQGTTISKLREETDARLKPFLANVQPGAPRMMFRLMGGDAIGPPDKSQDIAGFMAGVQSIVRETLPQLENIFLGPVHSLAWNDVRVVPAEEKNWQSLAQDCKLYPSGESLEEAYWRTLMGNKRHLASGSSSEPPQGWQDAYKIWLEMVSQNEGVLPRLRKGKLTSVRDQLHPFALDMLRIPRKQPRMLPDHLIQYFTEHDHEQDAWRDAMGQRLLPLVQTMMSGANVMSRGGSIRISLTKNFSIDSRKGSESQTEGDTPEKVSKAESHNEEGQNPDSQAAENSDGPQATDFALPPGTPSETPGPTPTPTTAATAHDPSRADQSLTLKEENNDHNSNSNSTTHVSAGRVGRTFERDLRHIAQNRQFCTTKKRYMGWVPPRAQKGDKIYILFGGQVPYVLRPLGPKDGKYEFVGEAYLHGLMDGEGVRIMGGMRIEDVELR